MPVERRFPVDRVALAMKRLVRLVVDDAWTAHGAAHQLRRQFRSDLVLRRVRARVAWGLVERPTPLGERALATLDAALALPVPVETAPRSVPARGR